MKHSFTRQIYMQGHTIKTLSERWGIQPRQMNNIARNPKQIHWDALKGAGNL